jgi:hypothetical protein
VQGAHRSRVQVVDGAWQIAHGVTQRTGNRAHRGPPRLRFEVPVVGYRHFVSRSSRLSLPGHRTVSPLVLLLRSTGRSRGDAHGNVDLVSGHGVAGERACR